jgi:membrane protein DedA with SNARE-associated domain
MSDIEVKLGGFAAAALLIGYAIYSNADAVKQFLAEAFIIGGIAAVVIAAIVFYFWQRSTKRSTHPWD